MSDNINTYLVTVYRTVQQQAQVEITLDDRLPTGIKEQDLYDEANNMLDGDWTNLEVDTLVLDPESSWIKVDV